MKKLIMLSCLVVATSVHAQNAPLMEPTGTQLEMYAQKFAAPNAKPDMQEKIASARERAVMLIRTQACNKGLDNYKLLGRYMAPDKLPDTNIGNPMYHMKYHDKSTCLDVERIDNFSAPAANALSYRVMMVSASSGESKAVNYSLVRQGDGEWLILSAR